MIKVKEFLDKNFSSYGKSTATLKKNGHYEVHGQWSYKRLDYLIGDNVVYGVSNKKISRSIFYNTSFASLISYKFEITCSCNNETIQINIIENGKFIGKYGYFQTYEHIPRGEVDVNGYYVRSTDDEIIRYLKSYMIDKIRNEKIDTILDDTISGK